MEVMYTPDGKPILIDYVRDGKTFADREYEKWLKERDKQKEHKNVQSKRTRMD